MAKTNDTISIEHALDKEFNRHGHFGCREVTIGWYGSERVDYLSMTNKGVFRAFEIKVSKADFKSSAAKSFVGHFNYYVMPRSLYDEVKDQIEKGVGVYIWRGRGFGLSSVKKASRRSLTPMREKDLQMFMIRSLARDAKKYISIEKNRHEQVHKYRKELP